MSADAVIAAELARLILGGRGPSRPELRMDLTGQMARLGVAHRLQASDIGRSLLPAMQRMAAAVRDPGAAFSKIGDAA